MLQQRELLRQAGSVYLIPGDKWGLDSGALFDAGGNTTAFSIPSGLQGNISAGEQVWSASCAGCHSSVKNNLSFTQLRSALANIGAMRSLNLSDQQVADLAAFSNRSQATSGGSGGGGAVGGGGTGGGSTGGGTGSGGGSIGDDDDDGDDDSDDADDDSMSGDDDSADDDSSDDNISGGDDDSGDDDGISGADDESSDDAADDESEDAAGGDEGGDDD